MHALRNGSTIVWHACTEERITTSFQTSGVWCNIHTISRCADTSPLAWMETEALQPIWRLSWLHRWGPLLVAVLTPVKEVEWCVGVAEGMACWLGRRGSFAACCVAVLTPVQEVECCVGVADMWLGGWGYLCCLLFLRLFKRLNGVVARQVGLPLLVVSLFLRLSKRLCVGVTDELFFNAQ